MIEKRKFSRVEFKKEAEILINGKKYQGEIVNLSLKGAYIKTAHQLQMGNSVEVLIRLAGDGDFDIDLKGKVVRSTNDGVGIMFDQIDLDSFAHLRNIIAYNFGDDDAIMDEFLNFITDKH